MILAHIAGLPLEEAFLSLAPLSLGVLAYSARCRLRGWLHPRRPRTTASGPRD
jgi:hypothetical protein